MNPDPIRWVVLKGPTYEFEVISGPQSRLESVEIPEQEQLGFEVMAVVDSEAEAHDWIETYKTNRVV